MNSEASGTGRQAEEGRHLGRNWATDSVPLSPTAERRIVSLRRGFAALSLFDLAVVVAIGSFSVEQWRGPAWNSPIWPLLPLLLNRLVELIALCLGNIFTSITTSAVQVFLAVINLILCTQRTPCTSNLSACIGVTLAISILILEVLIAVSVTLLVNWAHFMDWALANGHEMAWAAEGIAGRGNSGTSWGTPTSAPDLAAAKVPKQFVGVVQPSESSFAVAIVVDATCRAQPAPRA